MTKNLTHEIRTETHGVCSDLISREDAINAIENTDVKITAGEWDELTSAIKSIPSADRQPVDKEYLIDLVQEAVYDGEACAKLMDMVDRPTGEWEWREVRFPSGGGGMGYKCSKCGKDYFRVEGMKFCPNCGARMTGGEE